MYIWPTLNLLHRPKIEDVMVLGLTCSVHMVLGLTCIVHMVLGLTCIVHICDGI